MADYDLLIIGGGIHGAGIAQAGAAAGYRVGLLEQTALAHGTSSRSSKLIHGGLRYLESGQWRLVRESLRERRILLELAPELVRLVPFHIPIYRDTQRRPWQIRAGLALYAMLAGLRREARFRRLPRRQWEALDGLRTDGLQSVFRYYDAQTDDAALTRAVMRSAQRLGADLIMPARFTGAQLEPDGCLVDYEADGRSVACRTAVLINAAGPWSGEVLSKVVPSQPAPAVELVRGTHIALPGQLQCGVYYMEAPQDGRAVFAMPRGDCTLVGTTEAAFAGAPDAVRPSDAECDYLREVVGHYFPARRGVAPIGAYAGLRVLPMTPGTAFSRPRETMLEMDRQAQPRLVSVLGGKLTTYRATAERLVRSLAPSLPDRHAIADTRTLPLTRD